MISEYHRPEKMDEALSLLARKSPLTVPLGGGTVLSAPDSEERAVVDLQLLSLNKISTKGKSLKVGATATLQQLLQLHRINQALAQTLELEATRTLRQSASVAGSLVSADGRSPFAVAALAMDAQLLLEPDSQKLSYGELLPLRSEKLSGKLIREISFPTNADLSYQFVARTPKDLPILCIALAAWPGGRTRLVVGGFGDAPHLALDGKDNSGLQEALANVLDGASDQWASEEYRQSAGKALLARAIMAIEKEEEKE